MSSATMREDAGFCPVMMRPALTANGDMSATARTYLAPFCACTAGKTSSAKMGLDQPSMNQQGDSFGLARFAS